MRRCRTPGVRLLCLVALDQEVHPATSRLSTNPRPSTTPQPGTAGMYPLVYVVLARDFGNCLCFEPLTNSCKDGKNGNTLKITLQGKENDPKCFLWFCIQLVFNKVPRKGLKQMFSKTRVRETHCQPSGVLNHKSGHPEAKTPASWNPTECDWFCVVDRPQEAVTQGTGWTGTPATPPPPPPPTSLPTATTPTGQSPKSDTYW